MRHTPLMPLAAIFATPIAAIGLFFLAACSARPTPVAVSDLVTPTLTSEIITTLMNRQAEEVETVSPTPGPLPTKPASTETIPATVPVVISPLPSLSPAVDEPASPVAEVVSEGPAPDFTLAGAQGVSVTLSDYRDENPSNVLLVFYRGKT